MQAPRLPYPGPAWAADHAGEAAASPPPPGSRRGSLGGPQRPSQETALGNELGKGTFGADVGDLSRGGVKGTPTHFNQDSGGLGKG